MHNKVKVVACRTEKINTMFTAVVSIHAPKYISGQHLYEQAVACTAKWNLWRARLQNKYYMSSHCVYPCSLTCVSNGFLFFAR